MKKGLQEGFPFFKKKKQWKKEKKNLPKHGFIDGEGGNDIDGARHISGQELMPIYTIQNRIEINLLLKSV